MVLQDYGLRSYFALMDPFKSGGLETVTQLYLTGRGERSYFDARAMYFYGLSASRRAEPDSDRPPGRSTTRTSSAQPLFGGELTYRANIISLSRDDADFEPITQTGLQQRAVRRADRRSGAQDADQLHPARLSRHLFARLGGSHLAAHADRSLWAEMDAVRDRARRPRGAVGHAARPASRNFLPDRRQHGRPRHAGGRTRIPLSVHRRAVVGHADDRADRAADRPPERDAIGKLPNEDAQSLIFDDSNLFSVNKFSGWDRIEGGTRLNAGMQYTAQFNRAGFVNVAVRAVLPACSARTPSRSPDTVNTGLSSGLGKTTLGLCGARRLPAGQHLHVHLALPARGGTPSRSAASRSKGAPISIAGS